MSRIKAWHYWLVALVAFLLDRVSKYFACKYLGLVDYGVFPGFNLSLVYNRGVSFSMFSFVSPLHFWIISCLVIAILCIFAIHVWYEYKKGISIIGEVFVLAGALSNIIDRFVYGGVVDFLDFYFGYVHFPTFNLADCFIVCGILFIAFRSLWYGIIRKA